VAAFDAPRCPRYGGEVCATGRSVIELILEKHAGHYKKKKQRSVIYFLTKLN